MVHVKLVHFALLLGICLLVGGALGWVLKPDSERSLAGPAATAAERQRPARPSPARAPRFAAEFQAIQDRAFRIDSADPAQDFNYLQALATALHKKAGAYAALEGADSQAFSEILRAIAKGDLERTLDWIDQLDSFMEELHANIPPPDYGQFLGTAIHQQLLLKAPDEQLVNELLAAGLKTPAALAEALGSLPDQTVRAIIILDTVGRAATESVGQSGDLMDLRGALSLFKDPAERQEGIEGYARDLSKREGGDAAPRIIDALCTQLAILGHPDAALERIRSAAGKSGR